MEQDTPANGRRAPLLRSGPLRLVLIVGLTAVALLAPLVSAVRTTEAQGVETPIDVAPTPTPTPTPPASALAAPVPSAQVVSNLDRPTATEPVRAAPIVVVGPATSPPPTPDPVDVATIPTGADQAASCLLVEEPETQETTSWFRDNFDAASSNWRPLAGTWSMDNGMYVQGNPDGYDLITELVVPLPTNASVSVDMTAQGVVLGGGLMIGQPAPMIRNGATIVDFTNEGRFLRWGVYDVETGVYQYQGGVSMATDFDIAVEHTLTVELQQQRTRVLVDGALVGVFDPVEPGQVGLVTSASTVAFDNMNVRDLDEDATNGY